MDWVLRGLLTFAGILIILMVLDVIRYVLKRLWKELNDYLDERERKKH